ncbi:MAG: hypothetical protein J6S75_06965, partial [Thermoguttaceae bacterium]|nr:hypothetical protein [Thermoguttaceae bacterium]
MKQLSSLTAEAILAFALFCALAGVILPGREGTVVGGRNTASDGIFAHQIDSSQSPVGFHERFADSPRGIGFTPCESIARPSLKHHRTTSKNRTGAAPLPQTSSARRGAWGNLVEHRAGSTSSVLRRHLLLRVLI